jgi:signal transduction histidine kinase
MRRLILLGLLVLLLAQAVVVLYALGRAGITSETRRLEDDARRARVAALEAARDGLAADLDALVAREENRAWYHYRPLYLPPDLVATTVALVPSPLTEQPEDPLVRYYFEYRDGALTSPCLFTGAPDSPPWAERVRAALPELQPLVAELEREGALTVVSGEARREVIDQFVCETNAAPDLKLQQLAQTDDEPGQAQLKGEWDAYQSRMGKQTGQYARSQPQRGNQTVEVVVSPFRWSRRGRDPIEWPAVVVAARRVEVGGTRWLQGFALDLRHLRDVHLKAVTHRARKAPPPSDLGERDVRESDLASLEGSLPSTGRPDERPDTTGVLSAGAVPPSFASTRLRAPLDELALVDKAAPVDPRGLLAGSRTLLDGALALAFGVVVLGGALLGSAARSERRLAQQRSDFVAALTHELKAPLTGFRALTELLHDGLVPDEAKKREYYAAMLSESERLSRLVQNVLDASQLERGALRVVPEALDPTPLLEDAAARFRPRLESEGFRVEVDVPDDLPRAIADREAFAHVVGNLLDNAAKYGRGGELAIRLEARAAVDHAGSWLRVSVQDRGPGVSPRDRAKVFDRFYRGDAPRQVGGAGLGLTIARALARAMGGDLLLDDAPPPGARFTLRLPLAPPAPAQGSA